MADFYKNHLIDESYVRYLTKKFREAFDGKTLFRHEEFDVPPEDSDDDRYELAVGYSTLFVHLTSQLGLEIGGEGDNSVEAYRLSRLEVEQVLGEAEGFISLLPSH